MRITTILFVSLVSVGSSQTLRSISAFESTVYFFSPDTSRWDIVHNGLDPESNKYILMYKHQPIEEGVMGIKIEPVMAIVAEVLSTPMNVSEYSAWKRDQVPFEVIATLTFDKGHFSYPDVIGYEGQYVRADIPHRIFVIHMKHGNTGFQIICDSTKGVFENVEADMRKFFHSIVIE